MGYKSMNDNNEKRPMTKSEVEFYDKVVISAMRTYSTTSLNKYDIVNWSFGMADVMLAERRKRLGNV